MPKIRSSNSSTSNNDHSNDRDQQANKSIVPWSKLETNELLSSSSNVHSKTINKNHISSLDSDSFDQDNNCKSNQSPSLVFMFFKMIKYLILIIIVIFVVDVTTSKWYDYGINYGLCKFTECCHEDDGTGYIKYGKGTAELLDALNTKVHGQPLITSPIYRSIKAHLRDNRPSRPLVMYFSGWTGTGKTYVAKLIANSLYLHGMNSKFVKYISSSYHFPIKIEEHEVADQRQRLRDMIRETVKICERSLIIFDELDKLPPGVVDALQPLVDYIEDLDGVKYNKAIFIFLSNTGAEKLNLLSYKMFQEGKERNDLSSKDVEEILINESFNEKGGLRQSSLLKRYSIGVFVPFLPLQREHVKLCIRDEIISQNVTLDKQQTESLIEEISDELMYFPDATQVYSKSGCKGVHDKVINNIGPPTAYRKLPGEKMSPPRVPEKSPSLNNEL